MPLGFSPGFLSAFSSHKKPRGPARAPSPAVLHHSAFQYCCAEQFTSAPPPRPLYSSLVKDGLVLLDLYEEEGMSDRGGNGGNAGGRTLATESVSES